MTEREIENLLGSGVGDSAVGVERRVKRIVGKRGHDTSWCERWVVWQRGFT